MANTATLAGGEARAVGVCAAFVSARTKFMDRAAATTWTDTVEAARRLHAEAKRAEREREAAASTAATDEGGEA
jgi:hypothetical protein